MLVCRDGATDEKSHRPTSRLRLTSTTGRYQWLQTIDNHHHHHHRRRLHHQSCVAAADGAAMVDGGIPRQQKYGV